MASFNDIKLNLKTCAVPDIIYINIHTSPVGTGFANIVEIGSYTTNNCYNSKYNDFNTLFCKGPL